MLFLWARIKSAGRELEVYHLHKYVHTYMEFIIIAEGWSKMF